MRKALSLTIATVFAIVLTLSLTSAVLIIKSVDSPILEPGAEGVINIRVENLGSSDVDDVSILLNFAGTPFIPIGSSEETVEEIEEDKDEDFNFKIKVSNTAVPADYEIPYTLLHEDTSKSGSIGVKVKANPVLDFTVSTETPVVNTQGSITLKIVNKGFSDARFASVKIIPDGFTVLTDKEIYIGEIDSDDFETATFDVLFNSENANLIAIVEYKDFDNQVIRKNVNLPLEVFSKEKALELGIIQKSNVPLYTGIVVAVIILWFIYRAIRKRQRLKRSQVLAEGS
tara:strand:- start:2166 stop:3023 length:858 start_codon:yes stop_codon:yes gene_type:complete